MDWNTTFSVASFVTAIALVIVALRALSLRNLNISIIVIGVAWYLAFEATPYFYGDSIGVMKPFMDWLSEKSVWGLVIAIVVVIFELATSITPWLNLNWRGVDPGHHDYQWGNAGILVVALILLSIAYFYISESRTNEVYLIERDIEKYKAAGGQYDFKVQHGPTRFWIPGELADQDHWKQKVQDTWKDPLRPQKGTLTITEITFLINVSSDHSTIDEVVAGVKGEIIPEATADNPNPDPIPTKEGYAIRITEWEESDDFQEWLNEWRGVIKMMTPSIPSQTQQQQQIQSQQTQQTSAPPKPRSSGLQRPPVQIIVK